MRDTIVHQAVREWTSADEKNPPLDGKTSVGFLRTHSDYVVHLTTQLSALLTTMERALEGPDADLQAVMKDKAEPLAQLQHLLVQEAHVFCERLSFFLESLQHTKAD